MTDAVTPTPARRAALPFIFISVVPGILAFDIGNPVLPRLVEQFMDGNTVSAARVYCLFATSWALMQLCFARQLSASFLFADCLTGGAVLLASRSTRTELMPTVVVA